MDSDYVAFFLARLAELKIPAWLPQTGLEFSALAETFFIANFLNEAFVHKAGLQG